MNLNYKRGRQKEYELKKNFEELGYIVFRTSGSHGIADLIAVKPDKSKGIADLWPEVRFIQVKSSERIAKESIIDKFINHLKIEYWKFPTKTKNYYKKFSNKKKHGHNH